MRRRACSASPGPRGSPSPARRGPRRRPSVLQGRGTTGPQVVDAMTSSTVMPPGSVQSPPSMADRMQEAHRASTSGGGLFSGSAMERPNRRELRGRARGGWMRSIRVQSSGRNHSSCPRTRTSDAIPSVKLTCAGVGSSRFHAVEVTHQNSRVVVLASSPSRRPPGAGAGCPWGAGPPRRPRTGGAPGAPRGPR